MNEETAKPISASADGKTNSYVHTCGVVQQVMHYAACLHRLDSLESGSTKRRPADWDACKQACRSRSCAAQRMREEEVAAGKAIYFLERTAFERVVGTAREWIDIWTNKLTPSRSESKAASALDALASMAVMDYGDALIAAARAEQKPMRSVGQALPGETPLQMARRIAAERKNQSGEAP